MISKGNDVKFAHFEVIAFSEAKTFRFSFCGIWNHLCLRKGYQPPPQASVDNPYLDLNYSGYHKNLIH